MKVLAFELQAIEAVKRLVGDVRALRLESVDTPSAQDDGADFVARVKHGTKSSVLAFQATSSGEPRQVRAALLPLRTFAQRHSGTIPVLVAPYLSPQARALCREHEVGYVDLEGNARLEFDGIFIDRAVASKPQVERRELKGLFGARATQVLRRLLREPERTWRLAELSTVTSVSLGHVSNVKQALLNHEWARFDADGLRLTNPDALLDTWRDMYTRPQGEHEFYTVLHGRALEEGASRAFAQALARDASLLYASFSAATFLAPFGRVGTTMFFADDAGLRIAKAELKLTAASTGANVVVTLGDEGILRDRIEPSDGIACTSPVQTYLDLWTSGERGREAADHLRERGLAWTK